MPTSAKLLLGLALTLPSSFVAAQSNLGELLDAGAKKLSPSVFKQEVVQRSLVGPTTAGGEIEVMYVANGTIQGLSSQDAAPGSMRTDVAGDWTIDEENRICTAIKVAGATGRAAVLPARCQYWFKLGGNYYIADSDVDRRAKVLLRKIKSSIATAPSNLGELLDAGARRVSPDEFKREVVQRMVVGRMATGHRFEIMYAANGSIAGAGVSPRDPPDAPKADNPISGEWKVGDVERICTTIRLLPNTGGVMVLPAECQLWFRLGSDYFVASSDSDRRAKVFQRMIQP